MKKYSVIITTSRPANNILPLFTSLSKQEIQAEQIFLVIDKKLNSEALNLRKTKLQKEFSADFFSKINFISNQNSDFIPNQGVSFNRNFAAYNVKSELLLSVDDDNEFKSDFTARLLKIYSEYFSQNKQEVILVPTEIHNGQIRSRGYSKFRYAIGAQKNILTQKPISDFNILNINFEKLYPIQFASSNCFFGPTKVFQSNPFDERMKFIYEDFDFFSKISKNYPLFVVLSLEIQHNMRKKSKLEESYLADENGFGIYEKSKNRVLFVKNNGSFFQKLLYFTLGLHIHSAFLFSKILFYAPRPQKLRLTSQMLRGTLKGLLYIQN